jgi:hypothetical protein
MLRGPPLDRNVSETAEAECIMRAAITILLFVSSVVTAGIAYPCTRTTPVSAPEMVAGADLIVRATAGRYVIEPQRTLRTNGEPESRIRFLVRETVKGSTDLQEIVLPGYLSDEDDFNDHPAPYQFVRPNGRSGSCVANTYRSGADFLLVLKGRNGTFTTNWYALGPTNEQLHPSNDPWLLWVREEVKRRTALASRRLHPMALRARPSCWV